MTDNVILNKSASIRRCLARIRDEYAPGKKAFLASFTVQDAVVLNLQRACEQSIDLASYLVREKRLGVPQSRKEEFQLLEKAGLLPMSLSQSLQAMVGYRNIAVHEYQSLSLEITVNIVEHHLQDFEDFVGLVLSVV